MFIAITRLTFLFALGCCAVMLAGRVVAAGLPGGQIVFSSNRDGDYDLYLLDVRSGFMHNLMFNDATDARDDQAAWSPDGERLVYRSNLDGPNVAMILDLKTGRRYAIASNTNISFTMGPVWSPDGETVALAANNGLLALVDAESGARRPLPQGAFLYAMSWSPDGREIVYSAPSDVGVRLYGYEPDTGTQRLLTPRNASYNFPAWSPDGRLLAAIHQRDLFVLDESCLPGCADGARRLTNTAEYDIWPSWSPDGRQIVYECISDDRNELCLVDVTTGAARQLTHSPVFVRNVKPAWRPD